VPELPEVETIRRQLAATVPGAIVTAAGAHPSPKFADATRLVRSRLVDVQRRGKYLIVPTDDARELVIHLGMTGRLELTTTSPASLDADGARPWRRAWWTFDDGRTLCFDDQRRFGRVAVVAAGHHAALPTLASLGPDPFDAAFTPERLHRSLVPSRRKVKTALLSQRFVAGIGNIYADEALWRAGVAPHARRVGRDRCARLHEAIVSVLAEAIDHGGTRLRDYRSVAGDTGRHQFHLDCYGRAGEPCNRCGATLVRGLVDGRGTTWCPTCQTR
jgi:formamidopyrimidine-DNA glycosylase